MRRLKFPQSHHLKNPCTSAAKDIMHNTTNKSFSRHTFANTVRLAAIAAGFVTMSALTLPKPPTEITFNIDSTDTTATSDSSDANQSNLVSACVCDLNQDHAVDSADLGTLLGSYGPCQSGALGDFNFDAVIDSSDLGTMLGNFGPCSSDLAWATVLQWNPDPDVVLDADVRAKISASGYPWSVRDTGTGIEMLLIPGGTFNMGCSASNSYGCYSSESPNHQVTLSKAFYLGKTEVTQAQWQAKMSSNPSYYKSYSDSPSRPVETVSWNDIAGFNTATGLRLPSEAEWEYACRGGTTTAFHSMPGYPNGTNVDSLLGNIAWFYPAAVGFTTYVVAGKAANAFGMYDMSGNVFEWCNDWWGNYTAGNATDPAGPSSGSYRVLRGGGWSHDSYFCRSSYRLNYAPGGRFHDIGFRVARTP
jgi:formylglycine-generating enzyme required for sulfatase activity